MLTSRSSPYDCINIIARTHATLRIPTRRIIKCIIMPFSSRLCHFRSSYIARLFIAILLSLHFLHYEPYNYLVYSAALLSVWTPFVLHSFILLPYL
jgi:hypothetical protein